MIAPQVPAGDLIGQAVLHNESDGQRNDAMRVMSLGQRVVGHVRVEMFPARRATMLRVNEVDVARPTCNQIPNVVKNASPGSAAETRFVTTRTRAMGEVSAAINDLRFGQIFGSCDAFRDIRQILSGARHDKALLGQLV
jgi:hypothetical protein